MDDKKVQESKDRLKKNIIELMDVFSQEIEAYLEKKNPILEEKDRTFERLKGLITDAPKMFASLDALGNLAGNDKSTAINQVPVARSKNGNEIKSAKKPVFI